MQDLPLARCLWRQPKLGYKHIIIHMSTRFQDHFLFQSFGHPLKRTLEGFLWQTWTGSMWFKLWPQCDDICPETISLAVWNCSQSTHWKIWVLEGCWRRWWSKYPYSICVHFISSCSFCSTLGSAFCIIAVRMSTCHVNFMADARSDRNLMVIFAPLCMERMKSLMVGTWSCSSQRWQSRPDVMKDLMQRTFPNR